MCGGIRHPRVTYPSKKESIKFDRYGQKVDTKIKDKGLEQRPLTISPSIGFSWPGPSALLLMLVSHYVVVSLKFFIVNRTLFHEVGKL